MEAEIINTLRKIGLTEGESKVYLALLKRGESPAKNIIKETEMQSSAVYSSINRIVKFGLISYMTKNKIKHFRAAPQIN